MTVLFKSDATFAAKFAEYLEQGERVKRDLFSDVPASEATKRKKILTKMEFSLGKDILRIVQSLMVKHQILLVTQKEPGCVELSNGTRILKQADGSVRIDANLQDCVFDAEKGELAYIQGTSPCILQAISAKPTSMSLFDLAPRLTDVVTHQWVTAIVDQAVKQPLATAGFSAEVFEDNGAFAQLTAKTTRQYTKNFFREKTKGCVVGKALWECVLDPAIFSLTLKAYGKNATLAHYNHVAHNLSTWQMYAKETPHLVRMIGAELVLNSSDYTQTMTTTMLQSMRERFFSLGGTQSGWSFLTRQSSVVLGHVWSATSTRPHAVSLLNRLGALGCKRLPYGRWLFYVFDSVPTIQDDGPKLNESLAWLTMMLVTAFHSRKLSASTLLEIFRQIEDYLHSENVSVTSKATFQGMMRKAETWHRQRFQRDTAQRMRTNCQWQPLLQELQVGSVSFKSLNSSLDLEEEGRAMLHCVSSYGGQCFENRCRIYQVRLSGVHIATLEVRWSGKSWTFGQLYGPRNSKILSKKVNDAVKTLIRQCNKPGCKLLDRSLNIDFNAKAKEEASASTEVQALDANQFGLNREALYNEAYILAA